MKVKIISHSAAPSRDKTPLELVAYCARVSNPSNQNNSATSEKLVKYLVKHKHWSPLEMVNVCLEIETYFVIGLSLSKSFPRDTQTLTRRLMICLRNAKPECKMKRIVKTR